MNMFLIFCELIIGFLILDYMLKLLINYLKKDFQWLITKADEIPSFSPSLLDKFFSDSFDSKLGWCRKPNSFGFDKGENGKVKYTIDSDGSRELPESVTLKYSPQIACFGDSYTFCRQVENAHTWQAFSSELLESHILNFGVGNYGLDQALIRYNDTVLPASINTVIMGVVPETICRVHSYWKHYLEFGNILAFKPRYILKNGTLELCENPINSKFDFYNISRCLNKVQKNDNFYLKKFKRHQLVSPFIFSFLKLARYNTSLVYLLIKRKIFQKFKLSNSEIENAPFSKVMEKNLIDSHDMYKDKHNTDLLKAIIIKFKNDALRRGHKPLIIIMPQLGDLRLFEEKTLSYEVFYENLKQELDILDLTKSIRSKDYSKFYINDQYGGHFSKEGNLFVSKAIVQYLSH